MRGSRPTPPAASEEQDREVGGRNEELGGVIDREAAPRVKAHRFTYHFESNSALRAHPYAREESVEIGEVLEWLRFGLGTGGRRAARGTIMERSALRSLRRLHLNAAVQIVHEYDECVFSVSPRAGVEPGIDPRLQLVVGVQLEEVGPVHQDDGGPNRLWRWQLCDESPVMAVACAPFVLKSVSLVVLPVPFERPPLRHRRATRTVTGANLSDDRRRLATVEGDGEGNVGGWCHRSGRDGRICSCCG